MENFIFCSVERVMMKNVTSMSQILTCIECLVYKKKIKQKISLHTPKAANNVRKIFELKQRLKQRLITKIKTD